MGVENKYPIYSTSATWIEKGMDHPNSTSFQTMFPIGTTIEGARQDAIRWWDAYQESTGWNKDKPPLGDRLIGLVSIEVRYVEHESWVSGWFQHITRNVHLSDDEILQSFFDFVSRKTRQNIRNGHESTDTNFDSKLPYHCLMGAEDEWRWKLCRCEHCQKRGVVTIDH